MSSEAYSVYSDQMFKNDLRIQRDTLERLKKLANKDLEEFNRQIEIELDRIKSSLGW